MQFEKLYTRCSFGKLRSTSIFIRQSALRKIQMSQIFTRNALILNANFKHEVVDYRDNYFFTTLGGGHNAPSLKQANASTAR